MEGRLSLVGRVLTTGCMRKLQHQGRLWISAFQVKSGSWIFQRQQNSSCIAKSLMWILCRDWFFVLMRFLTSFLVWLGDDGEMSAVITFKVESLWTMVKHLMGFVDSLTSVESTAWFTRASPFDVCNFNSIKLICVLNGRGCQVGYSWPFVC